MTLLESPILRSLRRKARELKHELVAVALAARHPGTPWPAKLLAAGCVAYAPMPAVWSVA